MASITDYTQMAVTAVSTASSLTRSMGIGVNGTQPAPQAGTRAPSLQGAAMSAMYAVAAGGKEVNSDALSSIATNLVSTSSNGVVGNIGTLYDTATTLTSASSALKDISNVKLSDLATSAFSDEGLASVANAAFGVASEELGLGSVTDNLTGLGALAGKASNSPTDDVPTDWIFITAPQSISWDKQGETALVNTYGSNNPYVIYSSTGSRKLSLSECLVEGFSAGREVEDHVLKLEKLMTMVMNTQKGYVSPYVWDLRAGEKSYGYFIIESVGIQENMRNAKGRADRATANISLQQVPEFQINSGRDLATRVDLASGTSIVTDKDKSKESSADKAGTKRKASDGGDGSNDRSPDPLDGRGAEGGGELTGAEDLP